MFRELSLAYEIISVSSAGVGLASDQASSEKYTWQFLDQGGRIVVNKEARRASVVLAFPADLASEAATMLGVHVVEDFIEVEVGIWRDENVFVFLVQSNEEAKKLFDTKVSPEPNPKLKPKLSQRQSWSKAKADPKPKLNDLYGY